MSLKIVLAEDNEFFRKSLLKEIQQVDAFRIEYIAEDGEELLESVRKIKPEVVITDIDMPKVTGIEAAKLIREEFPDTEIIFVTSFDEYMKEAVSLYAFDYIEKPINKDRLIKTLKRLKDRYQIEEKMCSFKIEDGFINIPQNKIHMIEAKEKKSIVYTSEEEYEIKHSLKEVKGILADENFFKSSRSYIVNIKKIESINNFSRTSLEISFFKKEYKALLSKKLLADLRKII